MIKIFTDGSVFGQKNGTGAGPGGWAFLIEIPDQDPIQDSGGFSLTTNNRMELYAVIAALENLHLLRLLRGGNPIEITSDSQYFTKNVEFLPGWESRDWMTFPSQYRDSQPVKNRDLWEKYRALSLGASISLNPILRMTMPQNKTCDENAKAAAAQPHLPPDPGYS